MKSKNLILLIGLLFLPLTGKCQNFNSERIAWVKYLQRMYKSSPFDGIKVLEDTDGSYLLSVLKLDPNKYGNKQNVIFRIATIKAQEQASRFFNSSKITCSDILIQTKDANNNDSTMIIEKIQSDLVGFVKGLELVNSFQDEKNNIVFIYASKIK